MSDKSKKPSRIKLLTKATRDVLVAKDKAVQARIRLGEITKQYEAKVATADVAVASAKESYRALTGQAWQEQEAASE